MLLQKIKDIFTRLNYFLRRVFIPNVLNILMILSLFLVYTFALGATSLILRFIKPKLFSSKRSSWQEALPFDLSVESARRQS